MWDLIINYNGQNYIATYNEQTGFYEVKLTAPEIGGIYEADITYNDIWNEQYTDSIDIQIWAKKEIHIETSKNFVWIFDYEDFTVKDIVEISEFEINIDEETNANSTINVLKKTTAKSGDIVAFKKNNEVVYWGIIEEIQNENGNKLYKFITKYITNIFDRKIKLQNQDLIKTTGVEDFIANAVDKNFISNQDTFINVPWLELNIASHTTKQTSVTNVDNGIYNLHTWITNCTQNYNIVYSFSLYNKKLIMEIKLEQIEKELVDTLAESVSNYTEVFETDVISKVTVLYSKVNESDNPGEYTLYLLIDRTTTTDKLNPNRAKGKITTIYTENYEDANQAALDSMKANSYNHNITFDLYKRYIKVGTPIAIKTKDSKIYSSYISAIKITSSKFYQYICGNIRINFIDKLLKERRN